jgi:DNA polymerase/3'-5' exonuclease PolX
MSDNTRIARDKALVIAEGVIKWLESYCTQIAYAGSLRREKETVGDIEIVCLPHNPIALSATLDNMVEAGTIKKRVYGWKTKQGQVQDRTRWGDKLKCFILDGTTVELHIGDIHNFGYLYWLNTGPDDGNKFVMSKLAAAKAAIRFDKGYGWLVDYTGNTPVYQHKLALPDEQTLFKCLGMDFIRPLWRSERVYNAEWRGALVKYQLDEFRVREPKQQKLF